MVRRMPRLEVEVTALAEVRSSRDQKERVEDELKSQCTHWTVLDSGGIKTTSAHRRFLSSRRDYMGAPAGREPRGPCSIVITE